MDQILMSRYAQSDLRVYLAGNNGRCLIVLGAHCDTWGHVWFLLSYPAQLCCLAVTGGVTPTVRGSIQRCESSVWLTCGCWQSERRTSGGGVTADVRLMIHFQRGLSPN